MKRLDDITLRIICICFCAVVIFIVAMSTSFTNYLENNPPDSRPICTEINWGNRPTSHPKFGDQIIFIKSDKTHNTYAYLYESSNLRQFNYKTYLKSHPKDFVYITTPDRDGPQILVIFSNDKLDENYLQPTR